MLTFTRGDLFAGDSEALVNPVNCVGVMGKGLARVFKQRYPLMFADYRARCRRGEVRAGVVVGFFEEGRWIINVPTKKHWRSRSRLEDVEAGIAALRAFVVENSIASVAVPPLGCGYGGLAWPEVRALLEAGLSELPGTSVVVYVP